MATLNTQPMVLNDQSLGAEVVMPIVCESGMLNTLNAYA